MQIHNFKNNTEYEKVSDILEDGEFVFNGISYNGQIEGIRFLVSFTTKEELKEILDYHKIQWQ